MENTENTEEVETKEEYPESIKRVRVFIIDDLRNIKEVELDVMSVLQQNNITVRAKETILNYVFLFSILRLMKVNKSFCLMIN